MEKTLSPMWDLMDFSQQPTLSQTASIWVKISYLTIRKADFRFGGLLKHLSVDPSIWVFPRGLAVLVFS